jgi:uncharacterized protein (DUF433 family)
MTATEKLYQLIQTLPESQINEILHFAESLQQKQITSPQSNTTLPNTLPDSDLSITQTIPREIALAQIQQLIEKIEKTPGIVSGDACIKGTRIPVWELVEYRQLGASTRKILEAYPQLTEPDLQAAWNYYHSFPEEITAAIAENTAA